MPPADNKPSDETLVRTAAKGDEKSFEILVQRHFNMVFALALARLGNHESAEDLAQETFLRAFLHLGKLTQPRHFGTWVGRIARNLAADWVRRNQRASLVLPTISLEQTKEEIKDQKMESIREQLDEATRERMVNDAIMKLPVDQREILLLHYGEGWNYREIAEKLEKDPTTVGRNLRKAVEALQATVGMALDKPVAAVKVPRASVARTVALIAAASALPAPAKASLAAATAAIVDASAISAAKPSAFGAVASVIGWLKSLTIGQGIATVVTVGALTAGGTEVYRRTHDQHPAIVQAASNQPAPAAADGPRYDVNAPGLEGPWVGEHDYPRIGRQRGVFLIERKPDGGYKGVVYNADEACGVYEIRSVDIQNDTITFTGDKTVITFVGKRTSPSTLKGVLIEGRTKVEMTLHRVAVAPPVPKPPPRPAIVLPEAKLRPFVGTYARSASDGLRVDIQESALAITWPTSEVEFFHPETETRFFSKTREVYIEFARDGTGNVVTMTQFRPRRNERTVFRKLPEGSALPAPPTRIPQPSPGAVQ